MISKEEEKNYKKPKINKIWNFLLYGSTIAIVFFNLVIFRLYIYKQMKKGLNVKRRNALIGKGGNVSVIIELVDS